MQSLGTFKRGDTFSFTATIADTATAVPLTGAAASLSCHGRHYMTGALIDDLTVTETDVAGTYLFTAGDTGGWIPGTRVLFDVEYTDGSVIASTETFYVDVEADITHD